MQGLARGDGRNSHVNVGALISLLIVDDYEVTRSALAHLVAIKLPDATIHVAEDYASSLELCSRHDFDILITDLKRATLRVPDIFQRIIAIHRDLKLILTTGSSDKGELAGIAGMKNITLLEKPVDFAEMFAVIQKVIAEKGARGPFAANREPSTHASE